MVLAIIFLIYFIELNKKFYLKNKDSQNNLHDKYWITLNFPFKVRLFHIKKTHFNIIEKVENILYIAIYVLIFLGLIAYGGEIKDTLTNKKNVTWFDVFADTNICHMKDKRPFIHYLKLGLGLKL